MKKADLRRTLAAVTEQRDAALDALEHERRQRGTQQGASVEQIALYHDAFHGLQEELGRLGAVGLRQPPLAKIRRLATMNAEEAATYVEGPYNDHLARDAAVHITHATDPHALTALT